MTKIFRESKGRNKRIIVIGSSCSGKSTFAKQLANNMRLDYIQLDQLHWLPQWQERPADQFMALIAEHTAKQQWVVDGNYSVVRDMLWPRATTIIWLNLPFHLVYYRAISRTIRRVLTQEKLYSDNVETFSHSFLSKESIPWWVLITFHAKRKRYGSLLAQLDSTKINVVELRTKQQVDHYLKQYN